MKQSNGENLFFWYSQKQARILTKLGAGISLCRVTLCGESVVQQYTSFCEYDRETGRTSWTPPPNLNAAPLGPGEIIFDSGAENVPWTKDLVRKFLGQEGV